MVKAIKRYVNVDMGYETNECWYRAKVIESRFVKKLFSDELEENLLVELPGGERITVGFWKENNDN